MQKLPCKHVVRGLSAAAILVAGTQSVSAYQLYADDQTHINADLLAVFGAFHSEENYAASGTLSPGSSSWKEGFVKYGLSLDRRLGERGTGYGAFSLVSSGTWGDGDAAGFTDGSERTTKIEDAYIGWRSGNLFPAFGKEGVDFSFGRQSIVVGDGFIIGADALNLGKGTGNGEFNRGGAYYLAGRKDFDETIVLRLGGKDGWRGDLMSIKSDNRAQANTAFLVGTLEHVAEAGTVGLTYVGVRKVDDQFASPSQRERDGMKTFSLRAQGNAGVENLFLSGEFASQEKRHSDDESAWYLEAGWSFSDTTWKPSVNYRYSRFSENYDPLFYGNTRIFGTWFQGEVAANYAGPFNSNTRVHNIGIKASPLENLNVGLLWYDFSSIDKKSGDLSGRELDVYAEWKISDHFSIVPLVGLYKPEETSESGGSQLGNNDRNLYSQLIMVTSF